MVKKVDNFEEALQAWCDTLNRWGWECTKEHVREAFAEWKPDARYVRTFLKHKGVWTLHLDTDDRETLAAFIRKQRYRRILAGKQITNLTVQLPVIDLEQLNANTEEGHAFCLNLIRKALLEYTPLNQQEMLWEIAVVCQKEGQVLPVPVEELLYEDPR